MKMAPFHLALGLSKNIFTRANLAQLLQIRRNLKNVFHQKNCQVLKTILSFVQMLFVDTLNLHSVGFYRFSGQNSL